MLNAARAQGMPTMVIAMMIEAMTQPTAIHRPPNRIQATLSRNDRGDIACSLSAGLAHTRQKVGTAAGEDNMRAFGTQADFLRPGPA